MELFFGGLRDMASEILLFAFMYWKKSMTLVSRHFKLCFACPGKRLVNCTKTLHRWWTIRMRTARRSRGSAISKKKKLYVTLRWLTEGSYLDLCLGWGILKSAFFSTDPQKGVVWPTIEAIDRKLTIGIPYDDPNELEKNGGSIRCLYQLHKQRNVRLCYRH